MRIEIVLFEGFDELDVIGPFEVLRRAAEIGADMRVALVTLGEVEEVVGAYGLRVRPDGRLGRAGPPDALVVPGGGWNRQGPHGVRAETQRGELPAAIARLHATGTIVATVCTGAMLAAAAGLTAGRPAATHHLAQDDLRVAGANVVAARVVDDGDLISAGGVTSGVDLALWLVERFAGSATALAVESRLEHERRGTVWRRPA
jgi:transcriptional regulator GlxA family with amidase domain